MKKIICFKAYKYINNILRRLKIINSGKSSELKAEPLLANPCQLSLLHSILHQSKST